MGYRSEDERLEKPERISNTKWYAGICTGATERRTNSDKTDIDGEDISEICGISESKAYQIIRKLNEELEKAGVLTFRGRVSRAFFYERMYGMKNDQQVNENALV